MSHALTAQQRALAQAMGSISERAFSACWIDRLEFLIWHRIVSKARKIGRVVLTDTEKTELRVLSGACGGWIVFDDIEEEAFVTLSSWLLIYEEWCGANATFLGGESQED